MPSWSAVSCFRPFNNSGSDGAYSNKHKANECKENDSISEDRKGVTVVELLKKCDNLGIVSTGGIDRGRRPRISNLRPGSIAQRCDCLLIGDFILSINGIRTSKLKHDEIAALLENTGEKVILEIEYELPISAAENCNVVCPKVIQLKLEKENETFGFTLRGGSTNEKSKSRPLTITHVRFGGPANREGSIKSGDRLLAVDGINLIGATLHQALNILKQISGTSIFTIEYDVSVIDTVRNASGPLLVEIDKTPLTPLGINLTCLLLPEASIVIESIRQASIAERCGALHVGDHVLAIDDIKVDHMSSAEAMQLLKSSTGNTVKLEILPISQMVLRRVPENQIKRGGTIPNYIAARMSYTNSCYNTLFNMSNISADMSSKMNGYQNHNRSNIYNNVEDNSCNSSTASLGISSIPPFPSIGHIDTTMIMLHSGSHGFGFTVQAPTLTSDLVTGPAVINSIESGSPAEKCGVLQVGDRVLLINGKNTEYMSFDELTQLIVQSCSRMVIKTEFDISGSVVPSSGTFVVKLAKRFGVSLGITLAAPNSRQLCEPLVISSVEKGSVTHRSGTIQPGDRLLAVDQMRMENLTVEDAMNILDSYVNEIVSLRIRKDEFFAEDPEIPLTVMYNVELERNGGPLGITISGTEEPFDPIFISGISESGLAERTGTLQVGDRILSINGCCLHGKPLSDAIQILQSCEDGLTTFKISRSANFENGITEPKYNAYEPENFVKTFMTAIPSVDSALESWDSCNLEAGNTIKSNGGLLNQNNIPSFIGHDCQPSTSQKASDQHCRAQTLDFRSHNSQSRHIFTKSDSFSSKERDEKWSKILENLETCGQSEQLRVIENTILGVYEDNDTNVHSDEVFENFEQSISGVSHLHSDTLSETNLFNLNAQIEELGDRLRRNSCVDVLHPRRSYGQCNVGLEDSTSQQPVVPSYAVPFPVEVHKVTLFKDHLYEDFGFSISDGLYEHGVYIKSIRTGGPADLCGLIKPFDRILQVNNVKTYEYDCCLTVPLIASSGDVIELVLSRPAYDSCSSSESTLGGACGHEPWTEEDNDDNNSFHLCSEHPDTQTLTKTL